MKEMNCIYIPRCADGSLYRGWTDCLGKRIETHNLRKDAKYAKGHCPVTLAYYEEFITKEGAAE